jgi:rRNA pseudouridine-1189 N-methylase Emg1 (Nep1/Mra1 family)
MTGTPRHYEASVWISQKFQRGKIIVDSSYHDHSVFKITNYDNWKEFYPDAIEELPHNMPTPFRKKARIAVYVDVDHAHDTVT